MISSDTINTVLWSCYSIRIFKSEELTTMSPVKSQSRTNLVGQRAKPKTAKNESQQKNMRQNGSKASQPPSKVPQKGRGKSTSSGMKHNNKNKVNGRSQLQHEKEITDCKTTKGNPSPKAVTTKPGRVNNKLPTNPENKRSGKVTESEEEEEEESESDAGSSAEASEEETSDAEKEEHRGSNEDPAETQESEQSSEEEAEASDTKQTADEELLGESKSRSDSEVEPVASSTEEEENEKEAEVSEVVVSDGDEDSELNQVDGSEKTTATKVWRRRPTPRPSKLSQGLKYKMFKKTKADVKAEKEEKQRAKVEKQRLEKELKQKAKEEKQNKKKSQKENKPSSSTEETPPLKGHTLNKDNAVKGKTQKADTAKTKIIHMKDAPVDSNPDTEGEEEVEPTLSKAMKGQNQIMLLKAKGKDLKAILEPGVQQDAESVAKGRPQSLLLGKVKMASLRDKANKIKFAKPDVDTSVSEVTDGRSSKPKERLIAQRKGMTTLRRVSGWIHQNMPKGLNVRKKLSAWTKAIGVSRWLSLRAIKRKQGTRKSKGMILKHRMAMRAVSKTSLASRKHRSSSEDKTTKEKAAPQEKAEEGNGEPAPTEEKEIEAKYAVVLPRMNKLRMDRPTKMPQVAPEPSTPSSTTGSPGEPSTPERKPPKPGARLVLPVKPDLNLLKSIKKPFPGGLASDVAKRIPESIGTEGPSNTEDKDRSTAFNNKNGVNMLQAARGKLNPSQINLTKMSLSGGTIGGGPTQAKGSDPVREDAAGIFRSITQPFPNEETNTVMSGVRSLYEEEADREVAQLMGDSGIYTITQPEVHWAGNPQMNGDPQVCVPFSVVDSSRRITRKGQKYF